MSTLIGIFVAFAFFEWPWRGLILAGFLLFDAFEIWIWLRWRKRKSITGPEALIGKKGTAITNLQPSGEARVAGLTWKARALDAGILAGEEVEVVSQTGLELQVQRPA